MTPSEHDMEVLKHVRDSIQSVLDEDGCEFGIEWATNTAGASIILKRRKTTLPMENP